MGKLGFGNALRIFPKRIFSKNNAKVRFSRETTKEKVKNMIFF